MSSSRKFFNALFLSLFVVCFVSSSYIVSEAAVAKTTKVTMSKTSVSVYKGQKYQLKAKKANTKVKHRSIKWSTSNKKIVTVNQKGLIKGVKKGNAYIYCKVKWKNNKTTTVKCKVKVYNPVKLKSYKLSKLSATLKVGQKITVKKVIIPSNATIIKTAIATSNKKVAIINSKGVITAKGPGTAKLCMAIKTYNGKVYKKYVTVKVSKKSTVNPTKPPVTEVPVTSVTLDKTSGILKLGESATLKATVVPSNATKKTVTYKSSNTSVAVVNASATSSNSSSSTTTEATVTVVGVGTADITATSQNGKLATYKLTVLSPYEIKMDKEALDLKLETSGNVTATVIRNYGDAKVFGYNSSNNSVATVDKNGQVIAVSEGTAVITASVVQPTAGVPDKYNKVTCTVNVTKPDASLQYTHEPYVSTYYFEPRQDSDKDILIPIYVTDSEQKEYLHDDTTKRFDLLIEVDEKQTYMRNIKAGDIDVNLGKLTNGNHYFAFQVIDKETGVKSHKLYNDLYVVNSEEYAIKESEIYYMTEEDLDTYSIDNTNNLDEQVCISTKNGLNKLFEDIKETGYRKIVLQKGIYRIECENSKYMGVKIPSYFTVDMNGSTFKLNTIEEDIGGCLVYMNDTTEAHLTNGILEGDRFERKELDLEKSYLGEQINTFMFLGCTRSSISNMIVRQTTGHTIYSQYVWGPGTKVSTYTKTNIIDGKEYSCENTSTSNMIDISQIKEWSSYVSVGNAEGYRGVKGGSLAVYIHFYNDKEEYLETITTHQYRKVRIPNEAVYARFSMYGNLTLDDNLSFHTKHLGEYLEVKNIDFIDTRTTAIAVSSARHILFENMSYTRSGNSITPCAVDFEDGWQECQDVFYRNNKVIEAAGTATVIDNAGYNHIYEGNVGHHYTMRRGVYGGLIQNEVSKDVGTVRWTFGNIVNSKFNRIRNVENEDIYVWVSESDIERGVMTFVVKNCKIKGYIEDTPYKYVTYNNCTFTDFGARRITIKNSIIHPKTYWGTETYIYNSTFVNLENQDEGFSCWFNSPNAIRYFENCKFIGPTIFKTKNGFNSGTFNKCTFDNLKIEYGMEETVENGGLTFNECNIKSTADDFIYAGRYGYTRGLMEITFSNCNLDLGENNLIFLEGKPLIGSKIVFDNCIFNKNKGTLITGWNVIDSSQGQGLEVLFKNTEASKDLDKAYIEGKENFIVKYE